MLLPEFTADAYAIGADRLAELIADPATRERCRALAHAELSLAEVGIPRYARLYARVVR